MNALTKLARRLPRPVVWVFKYVCVPILLLLAMVLLALGLIALDWTGYGP